MTIAFLLVALSKIFWDVAKILKSFTPESLSVLEKGVTQAYVSTHDFKAMSSGIKVITLYFDTRNWGFRAFLFDISLCFFWVLWIWIYLHDKDVLSVPEFFQAGNFNAVLLVGSICSAAVLTMHSICTRTMMHLLLNKSTQSTWSTSVFFIFSFLTLWTFACLANGLFGSFGLVGLVLRNDADISFLLTFDWVANRFWVAFVQPFASSGKIELLSTGRYVYSWAILVPATLAPAMVLTVLGISHLLERNVLRYRAFVEVLFSMMDRSVSLVKARLNIKASTFILFRIASIACFVLAFLLM